MAGRDWTVERYADHFVNYLFDEYRGSRHVRRVATWVGFILMAVSHVGEAVSLSRRRQLQFTYGSHRFKVRYNHNAGMRGGIDIVEVLPGRGQPDGRTVTEVTSLEGAERLYRDLASHLDHFIGGSTTPPPTASAPVPA